MISTISWRSRPRRWGRPIRTCPVSARGSARLLAQRDERLEGRARELAADGFVRQARQGGILERARTQTERVVRGLLLPLGVREVVITFGSAKES